MKEKADFQAPFAALILILAGILSPSNGVDDGSFKTPAELVASMISILVCGLLGYLMWTLLEKFRKVSK